MQKRLLLSLALAACGTPKKSTISPSTPPITTTTTPPPVTTTPPVTTPPATTPPVTTPPPQQVGTLQAPDSIQFGYRKDPSKDGASFSPAWTSTSVSFQNVGAGPLGPLALALSAHAEFSLPQTQITSIAAGQTVSIDIDPEIVAGLGERIVSASLVVTGAAAPLSVPIFASVGDPALEDFTFSADEFATEATHALPRAPWPTAKPPTTPNAPYPDSAFVYMGLPPDFRASAPTVDVIVQLHGFSATLASTIPAKKYVQQAYFANRNAILIVPQGLYDYAADDFGQLRAQGGVQKLITEVLVALNRAGKLPHPVLGDVILSSHSGGYKSLSDMLTKSGVPGGISGVVLLDSLYGELPAYRAWVDTQSGKFVSSFQPQPTGDAVYTESQALAGELTQDKLTVATEDDRPVDEDLASATNLFHTVHAIHDQIPLDYYDLAEYWRHSILQPRRAPMPILRIARTDGSTLHLEWFAEATTHARSFTVQTSSDGKTFTALGAPISPNGMSLFADIAAPGDRFWVNVLATYDGLGTSLASDTYFVSSGTKTAIVVDAFDRCLDGTMHQLSHDYAARLGSDLDPSFRVQSCTNEAVEWGTCPLAGAALVVWVAGSSGYDNHSINPAAGAVLTTYLAAGGKLLASGSELAYAMNLDAMTTFMSTELRIASYADSSGSSAAVGTALLPTVGTFAFGQSDSYGVPFPDVLNPTGTGHTLLTYGTSAKPLTPAAVGSAQTVSVGFPLETVTPAATRTQLVQALVSYLAP